MSAKKVSATGKKFHAYIGALMDASDLKQKDIAVELGYDNANVISMFKKGITKVPIEKLPILAKLLGADPAHMARLALREYSPEFFEALESIFGGSVTKHEMEILKAIRRVSGNSDPKADSKQLAAVEKAFSA